MFLDSPHPLHPGFSSGFSVLLWVTVFCKISPKKSGNQSEFFHWGSVPQSLGLGAPPSLGTAGFTAPA